MLRSINVHQKIQCAQYLASCYTGFDFISSQSVSPLDSGTCNANDTSNKNEHIYDPYLQQNEDISAHDDKYTSLQTQNINIFR